jgi:hypothetical protein
VGWDELLSLVGNVNFQNAHCPVALIVPMFPSAEIAGAIKRQEEAEKEGWSSGNEEGRTGFKITQEFDENGPCGPQRIDLPAV